MYSPLKIKKASFLIKLAPWNFKIVAKLRDIQHNNHCFYNLDSFPLNILVIGLGTL